MPGGAARAGAGRRERVCALLALAVAAAGAGCAARLPPRPGGQPSPSPEALVSFTAATAHCRGLRTFTAELGLSGRAGDQKVRGRVIAGFERGGQVRLEGIAPFGSPVFILAARAETATLLLPRDRRVLREAPVSAVVERLTGLALGAEELLQALAGCPGTEDGGRATDGRQWPGGWRSVELTGGSRAFLRERAGAWQVVAVDAGGWRADYRREQEGVPREVRLRAVGDRVDLTASVRQVEINTGIAPAAFDVAVPPGTTPMTLDELGPVALLRTP